MNNKHCSIDARDKARAWATLGLIGAVVAGGVAWNWDHITGTEHPLDRGIVPAHVNSAAYHYLYAGQDPDPLSTYEHKCAALGVDRDALLTEGRTDGIYAGTLTESLAGGGTVEVVVDFSEGTMAVDRSGVKEGFYGASAYGSVVSHWSSAFSTIGRDEVPGYVDQMVAGVRDALGQDGEDGVNERAVEDWVVGGKLAVVDGPIDVDLPCYETLDSIELVITMSDATQVGIFTGKLERTGAGDGDFKPDYLGNPYFRPAQLT